MAPPDPESEFANPDPGLSTGLFLGSPGKRALWSIQDQDFGNSDHLGIPEGPCLRESAVPAGNKNQTDRRSLATVRGTTMEEMGIQVLVFLASES